MFRTNIAVVTTPTPKVTFTWPGVLVPGQPMHIDRRLLDGDRTWESLGTATNPATSFEDSNVELGKTYEYRLYRFYPPGTTDYSTDKISMVTAVATLNAPLEDQRGGVILVVDSQTAAALAPDLRQYEMDLAGDGWSVHRIEVLPGQTAAQVKAAVKSTWQTTPGINSLLLFGDVPVVYSGALAPDGHHLRPHETDTWYADMNDELWTDSSLNYTAAADPNNINIPGDGKFDQNFFPSTLELRVGRVLFTNIISYRKKNHEYLRDYLHKNHAWRHALRTVDYRAYVPSNTYMWTWTNWASPMLGTANIATTSGGIDKSYIFWASTSTVDPLLSHSLQGIFTTNFLSYKQTWAMENSGMMRNIAQPDWGLTSSWGAWPAPFLHAMAAGKPIGYSFLASQNNQVHISPSGTYNNTDYSYINYNQFERPGSQVHINLLGDPTLRMHPVPAVRALRATRSGGVSLSWAAPVTAPAGYHVYRSTSQLGPYQRLTSNTITGLQYTDSAAPAGDLYYQVRAVHMTSVATGTYFNQSQGVFVKVSASGAENRSPVAVGGTLITKCNSPLWLQFEGSDPDGDPVIPIVIKHPEFGQIRWQNGQAFYISSANFSGTETVTYVLSDGASQSEPAQMTIQVNASGQTLAGWKFGSGVQAAPIATYQHPNLQPVALAVRGYTATSVYAGSDQVAFKNTPADLDASKSIDWTVAPRPGYKVSLEGLTFAVAGPLDVTVGMELRASIDDFANHIVIPLRHGNTMKGRSITVHNIGQINFAPLKAIASLQNVTVPIKFRLHFWKSGDPAAPMSIGKLTEALPNVDAIEDFSVTGKVEAIPEEPADVIVDNASAAGVTTVGSWTSSAYVSGCYASGYIHDGNSSKGAKSVKLTPNLPSAGSYEVFAWWTSGTNRAASVPITIQTANGSHTTTVNQKTNGGKWVSLGVYTFNAGTGGSVLISNAGTTGHVIVDAVRFLRQ
ncbi:MAG: Ig-like domain-containing protein [Candidatus Methylacidiphilales bacterium]|nr:Ig-like domain-containing protein [Candidatus Methylacidiphilales bacterium]